MRITALGVSSAFATGEYSRSVRLADLEQILSDQASTFSGKLSRKALRSAIESHARTMYQPRWQSNFILEFMKSDGEPYRLVLDFGSDFRHSLHGAGLGLGDIHGYYCSHPHADHIGGIEGIALSHLFNPFFRQGKADWLKNSAGEIELVAKRLSNGEQIPADFKPDLYGHRSVLNELWSAARAGLETIQGVPDVNLQTYFNVHFMEDNKAIRMADGQTSDGAERFWEIFTVVSVHVNAGYRQMPSYGLMLKSNDGKVVFMPTDTQFMTPRQVSLYYESAQVIYQDCETGPRSDVHPHIDDLRTLKPEIKKKCLLYHFNARPEVGADEFMGILEIGDSRIY
jgi:ribonuclease BN (tRNA processing enzyme)